jgi:cytochrome c oxidase assembly factor CtaG
MLLDILRFEGQLVWNVPLLVALLCTAALYVYLVKYWTNVGFFQRQSFPFLLGLGLLYLTAGSPLSSVSHLTFSSHMIHMSVLYFIVPPLILAGIPRPLRQHLGKTARTVGAPFFPKRLQNGTDGQGRCRGVHTSTFALGSFSVLFLCYHIPFVLTLLIQHPPLHRWYLVSMFALAFPMWNPVAAPDPAAPLGKREKKRYAILSGLILMPACLLLIAGALMGGLNNPYLSQLTAELCLPPQQTHPSSLLPFPWSRELDQLMGGVLMLGMHKFSLMLTYRIGNKNTSCRHRSLITHPLTLLKRQRRTLKRRR